MKTPRGLCTSRLLAAALAVAFLAAGCAGRPVSLLTGNGPFNRDEGYVGCYTNFAVGDLVVDPAFGTAIVEGTHAAAPVMWPVGYTGRQSGSVVEVLDASGKVVAATGRRYQIEGALQPDDHGSWLACGYVLPK
jgi:hypothetical protein